MKKLLSTTALVAAFALTPAMGEEPSETEEATFGTNVATGETIYTDDNDIVEPAIAVDNYQNARLWDILVLGEKTEINEPVRFEYESETSSDMTKRKMNSSTIIVDETQTITEAAMETDRLSTLATLIEIAGLEAAFEGDDSYTVFAPSNSAFAKLDADTVNAFLRGENTDELRQILQGHVVEGTYMASDISEFETELETLGDTVITVERDELGDVRASDIMVTKANVEASNGVIHIVDEVIMAEPRSLLDARG
ncbi:MAG: fasciclin domain-containing protein [Pseudomonadota bacterium]